VDGSEVVRTTGHQQGGRDDDLGNAASQKHRTSVGRGAQSSSGQSAYAVFWF
jgi:hypothetical protein